MKQKSYKILLMVAVLSLCAFGIAKAHAEDNDGDAATSSRPNIKVQLENRIEKNREIRNTALETRKDIMEQKHEDVKDIRDEAKGEIKMLKASTTDMFKRAKDMRIEIKKKMEFRTFEIRKDALVRELKVALNNLDSISSRITSRISKAEGEGRDMSEPKSLLVIANEKLAKAKVDVAAFEALKIATSTTSTTASTTINVDLLKPRKLGDTAIKSVREARDAFKKVVVSIAHHMGLGNGTSTSTPPTATSTATTTGTN